MASIAKTAGTVGVVLALCGGVGAAAGCGGNSSSGSATHAAALRAAVDEGVPGRVEELDGRHAGTQPQSERRS